MMSGEESIEPHAELLAAGGYKVYHSQADVQGTSASDTEQSEMLNSVQVKFEPVDPDFEDQDAAVVGNQTVYPSTSVLPPPVHSQNVADMFHGSPSVHTQIREILGNKSLDSSTAVANVQNAIEELLKKNEDLLAKNDALGFKPNPRRGRLPGELGKHSQVVFPQLPGQFATFSVGTNVQGKISMAGSRSSSQGEGASAVPMGRIVRPKSPTQKCSIPEKDKSHFTFALMESQVGDAESEEIFSVQEHEMVCAVTSKTKFLNMQGKMAAAFDINFYWCNFCAFSTPNKAALLQHIMEHRFSCKYCRYQSFSRSDVIHHSVHTHPDFQEMAAITQYCTLLSDYLRVKNPKVARLDNRHRKRNFCSEEDDEVTEQNGSKQLKRSKNGVSDKKKNARKSSKAHDELYNTYTISVEDLDTGEEADHDGSSETQGKGNSCLSASSSGTVLTMDSSPRSQTASPALTTSHPVITQVFSAATFPNAQHAPSPLPQDTTAATSKRHSGGAPASLAPSGTAQSSPSHPPLPPPVGSDRASPQIRSNLYWSCGYCSFTSKSQSEIKDHSVREHSGRPHRYVALIKADGGGRNASGEDGSANYSVTCPPEQNVEKEAAVDGISSGGVDEDIGIVQNAENSSQPDQSPGTVVVKQEPAESDEELVPIRVRFPPARIQSKDSTSLKCYHCKYSSRMLGPLRNHILYNHKGSCLIGLGPMNCKVFMCPRADCTFRSSSGLTFLNHAQDCTPWSKADVQVEPQLLKCLEETIQMAQAPAYTSSQQPYSKVSTDSNFSCIYCTFSSLSMEETKHHVLSKHGEKQLVLRNVQAQLQRKKSFIFFCRSCPWRTVKKGEVQYHEQQCMQNNRDAISDMEEGQEKQLASKSKQTGGNDKVLSCVDVYDSTSAGLLDAPSEHVLSALNTTKNTAGIDLHATCRKQIETDKTPILGLSKLRSGDDGAIECLPPTSGAVGHSAKRKKLIQRKQDLVTGRTGCSNHYQLGDMQCLYCSYKCFNLKTLKEHQHMKHMGQCAVYFCSLGHKLKHVQCNFYACPSANCDFYHRNEVSVVIHYRQNHSSLYHPYMNRGYKSAHVKRRPKGKLASGHLPVELADSGWNPAGGSQSQDDPCYQCLYCPGYYYADAIQEMKGHYLDAHAEQDIVIQYLNELKTSRIYVCYKRSCDFHSDKAEELMRHMDRKHAVEARLRTYQCTSCGWITHDDAGIQEHISVVHGEEGGAAMVEIGQDERGSTVLEKDL